MKQSLVFVISMACIVILNGQPTTDNDEINQCTISKSFVMGKTHFGSWTKTIMCKNTGQVSGFRSRVEDDCGDSCDDSALNGIQLMCRDGTTTPKIEGPHGKWKPWQACGNNINHALHSYIDGFNFRSEPFQGDGWNDNDDTAGNNVKMQCDNGNELDGQGTKWGSWDNKGYQRCPSGSFLCGVQARIEYSQGSKIDETGVNQIKFLCCKVKVSITKSFVMGKTDFGSWTKTTMCKKSGQVSGFRLRVEDPCGDSCDDTGLNGIQLMCKDGTTTPTIDGPHGKWKPWQSCGKKVENHGYHSYIDGFNFRSEPLLGKGESDDDTAGNNVKMQCDNGNELDGQGTTWGSWDHNGYQRCPSDSFLCGVQARIEVSQGAKVDDTGVNQMKFVCCKVQGMCTVNDGKAYNQIPVDEMNADADIPEAVADIPEADVDIQKADADIPETDAATPDADATEALDF